MTFQSPSMQEDPIDRVSQRTRPDAQRPVGFQKWTNLLFVHWRVPAETLQATLPPGVRIDCHDGSAWLGLVPFYMSGVRPAWAPSIPWISNFCETNLRTYVVVDGKPGVWFYSLEASRLLPVQIARARWSLNYFWARMSLKRECDQVHYQSRRLGRNESAMTDIRVKLGKTIADSKKQLPLGSLEDFLAERYLLFTVDVSGDLLCGQVHHTPYPLRSAEILTLEQSITNASGFAVGDIDHVLFSEGVSTEIFALEKVRQ